MEIMGCGKQAEESNAPSLINNAKTGGQKSQAPPNMKVAVKKAKKKDQGAIWQPEEFKAASGVVLKEEQGDDRKMPEYEILHRQQVGATDAYLNLMESDGSSDHCHEMLVKIWLPDTQLKDISLDVLEDRVLLNAPKYRLNVALPYKVKKDSGNAKWDKVKGLLSVVIPINVKVKYFTNLEDALD